MRMMMMMPLQGPLFPAPFDLFLPRFIFRGSPDTTGGVRVLTMRILYYIIAIILIIIIIIIITITIIAKRE